MVALRTVADDAALESEPSATQFGTRSQQSIEALS
jgi:hypothetical protein